MLKHKTMPQHGGNGKSGADPKAGHKPLTSLLDQSRRLSNNMDQAQATLKHQAAESDYRRTSIADKIFEKGRRISSAMLSKVPVNLLAESQKLPMCANLADFSRLEFSCSDYGAFASIISQFSISQRYGDVPFQVGGLEWTAKKVGHAGGSRAPSVGGGAGAVVSILFKALLTQQDGFLLYTPQDDDILVLSVECVRERKSIDSTKYASASLEMIEVVGKVKNSLGLTLYRFVQIGGEFSRGGDTYGVVKVNDEQHGQYMKITARRPIWYRLAKWFGFAMDNRIFNCTQNEAICSTIKPKLSWSYKNTLGYKLDFEENCTNHTVKAMSLCFSMWAFLKFSPINLSQQAN